MRGKIPIYSLQGLVTQMKFYDENTMDLYYCSVYTRIRRISTGLLLSHAVTSEEVILKLNKEETELLWKMLDNGVTREILKAFFEGTGNGGSSLMAILIEKGMIE